MRETITRYQCDQCRKTIDKQGVGDDITPPTQWKWVELTNTETDGDVEASGLVCSPNCASSFVSTRWPVAIAGDSREGPDA